GTEVSFRTPSDAIEVGIGMVHQHFMLADNFTDAPTLLIGGTADPSWPAGAADRTGLEYLELPGADHGLELRGDAIGSAEFLVRVTAAMEAFVGGLSR
ncbi:hypothetical protein AB0J43_51055, partial [Nonomuraea fuscirosea]